MAQKVKNAQTSKTTQQPDDAAVEQSIALPTASEEDIETAYELIHISSDIVAGLSKYQQEILNFYSQRMLADLELQQKLMSCSSILEIWELQRCFFENASKQYSDEMQKLANLGQHIVPTELTGMHGQIN
ncbi:MAG: phasin family protein [Rhizobiaceae bacterium]|nr:phasin family protein [Rhizobiaceae bacterium]